MQSYVTSATTKWILMSIAKAFGTVKIKTAVKTTIENAESHAMANVERTWS